MSYSLSAILALGAGNSGLTLTASLFDSANTAAAGLTTSTLVEVAASSGTYLWTGTLPDGHRGHIRFNAGATFKTSVSINPQEVENSDVKTSSIIATVDAITGGVAIDGTSLTLERGDTWSIVVTGLGSLVGRSKLWFTLKSQHNHTDAQSLVQIEESSGLLYLNGAAAVTASDGSLVVTDASAGNVTITLKPAATSVLTPATRLYWDIQVLTSGVVTTKTTGSAAISADVTRSIA